MLLGKCPIDVSHVNVINVRPESPPDVATRDDVRPYVTNGNSQSVQPVTMVTTSPSQSDSAMTPNGRSPPQEVGDAAPSVVKMSAQPAHMVPSHVSQTTHLMHQSQLGNTTQPTYSAMNPVCSSQTSEFYT